MQYSIKLLKPQVLLFSSCGFFYAYHATIIGKLHLLQNRLHEISFVFNSHYIINFLRG